MDYLLELQALRENCPDALNWILLGISEFITVGGILIAAYIYWCTSKRAGAYILACFSGGYMLNQVIKNTACIYRPWVADPRIELAEAASGSATGYSFPSGHTLSATTVYGGTGIYRSKNKPFVAFMALMVVLTAFARNWLGAHTLQDVVAAAIEGIIILIINAVIVNWLVKKDESYEKLLREIEAQIQEKTHEIHLYHRRRRIRAWQRDMRLFSCKAAESQGP